MFKNLNLTAKIMFTIFIGIIGMLIISFTSYSGLNEIGDEIEEISQYQIPINKLVTKLEKDILEEKSLTYELLVASSDPKSQEFSDVKNKIELIEEDINKIINQVMVLVKNAIIDNHDDETKKMYAGFLIELDEILKEEKEFENKLKEFESRILLSNKTNIKESRELLYSELNKMNDNIEKLMTQLDKLLINSSHQMQEDEHQILNTIGLISTLVLISSLLISFIFVRSIRKSISNFQDGLIDFFKYLNREIKDVTNLDDSKNDEFGHMAIIINQNINKTKKNIDEDRLLIDETIKVLNEFEQGDLSQRLVITISNPILMQLRDVLNNMGENIENNIDNVLKVLGEYSNYNYMNKIDTKGLKEHLDKLAHGVNNLGDSITQMLIENKSNGLTLKESSDILLKNVDILNISSTSAASSLEETSAAVEEITGNIRGTTNNIVKMSTFTNDLIASANDGKELALKTSSSMEEINTQVTSINEAITIIDQIAFQTNILSLNAAVEAATAGEAGKGFAVVAAEVRNLASRSAEAAREIKDLVENANKKANEGKLISENMISGYQGLNENIVKTIELISDIESSSKEQLLGIEQINDAINSLDRQTQENAIVAVNTHSIAKQTDTIAKLVVSNANEKEFIGKDRVKAKKFA